MLLASSSSIQPTDIQPNGQGRVLSTFSYENAGTDTGRHLAITHTPHLRIRRLGVRVPPGAFIHIMIVGEKSPAPKRGAFCIK